VFRLLSFGKLSFDSVSSHHFSKIETEPSEKKISRSLLFGAMIVSHSLYIVSPTFAVKISSSGLYGRLTLELS
jgi:hypothetical protein